MLAHHPSLAALAILGLALNGSWAWAELSAEDYGVGAIARSESERQRDQALIDELRRQEAARELREEQNRQAEEGRRQAEIAAAEARRPPGERLTARYCWHCHDQDRIRVARHTAIGWYLTVTRMRWFNGARIPDEDIAIIRDHLVHTQAADWPQALLEYGLATLPILLPIGWALRSRLRRKAGRGRYVKASGESAHLDVGIDGPQTRTNR